ncbi:MAG: 3'-5' exonuclease [Candidatus Parvarchaeota archaeon]
MEYPKEILSKLNKEHTVIFDTETTGLSATNSSILGIGAIDVKTRDTFEQFCRARDGAYVDPKALERNGLANLVNDKTKPLPFEIERNFEAFCKEHNAIYLVGYNVGFDINFIYNAGGYYPDKPMTFVPKVIDLMEIMLNEIIPNKKLYPLTEKEKIPGKYPSLNDALSYFGSPPEPDPHTSGLSGAKYSAELYFLLKYNVHFIEENSSIPIPPIYEKIDIDFASYVHDIDSYIKHG